jgi:2-C-methyl-D-erythritol 4-phosphate cytidylyltransferase
MPAALVPAAGTGERLGRDSPKALVPLGGRPLVAWSIDALARAYCIDRIIIATPPGLEREIAALGAEVAGEVPVQAVAGGPSRSHSVANALRAAGDVDVVVVHDAARPLLEPELVDLCVARLEQWRCDGVVAAAPATDTVKEAARDGRVRATLDRSRLWAAQTPQAFRAEALRGALARAALDRASDDAQLVEATGGDVRIVEAPARNLKVTTPFDLRIAELLLAEGGSAGAPERS